MVEASHRLWAGDGMLTSKIYALALLVQNGVLP